MQRLSSACGALICVVALAATAVQAAESTEAITLVVMDPLAAPLSCPCVEGYAQRDYQKLADFISQELKREVRVVFKESLVAALKETGGKADLVIGKHSVVLADAKTAKLPLDPLLALAGKDGKTTMTGWFVVPAADPATKVSQLSGYQILFGPQECAEKHAAALALLKTNEVAPPEKLQTCTNCSDGATKILELGPQVRAATVISSYAAPLLEGCGTIKKGDLRVIGATAPVPFIQAFVSRQASQADRAELERVLSQVITLPELCVALETSLGFLPLDVKKK